MITAAYCPRMISIGNRPFPPEFDYSHLKEEQEKYNITCGIGKDAHFAPDYEIGLRLGWGGLLEKVRDAKSKTGDQDGLELLSAGRKNGVSPFFG